MTDKQIIFDDVDVKDCIAYAKLQEIYLGNTLYKQTEKVCMVKNQPCKFFDCQFKQMARELIRKEQECERLRFPMQDTNYAILAKEEFEEYKKLKQTLTEIKEIAEKQCVCGVDCIDMKQILQKISEVEE